MAATYWSKQEPGQPLFPDLLWSRPENKLHAGKLLVVGGNLYGFSAPAEAYQAATVAGIGSARVLLPECLRKTLGQHLEAADFAACTPSGSFSRQALGEWLDSAAWADGVLLAGDLGRNSETAVLIEGFLDKYPGQVTLTKDAVEYAATNPKIVLNRSETLLVLSLSQLQKLTKAADSPRPVTFNMDMLQLVEFLHQFTAEHKINFVVRHLDNIFVAVKGEVSTTKLKEDAANIWRVKAAARGAVWWLQHPEKTFESLTTSVSGIDNSL